MFSNRRKHRKFKKRFKNLLPKEINILPEVHSKEFRAKISRVIDGDTIEIVFLYGEKVPMKICIRIVGVDTPEKRTKNLLEKQAALKVKEIVENWIGSNKVKAVFYEWDKFGGRIVGDIIVKDEYLSEFLINNQYAHVYTGKNKKIPFTDEELEYILSAGNFV